MRTLIDIHLAILTTTLQLEKQLKFHPTTYLVKSLSPHLCRKHHAIQLITVRQTHSYLIKITTHKQPDNTLASDSCFNWLAMEMMCVLCVCVCARVNLRMRVCEYLCARESMCMVECILTTSMLSEVCNVIIERSKSIVSVIIHSVLHDHFTTSCRTQEEH